MDLSSIKQLLMTISVNYPAFTKQITGSNGSVPKEVTEEWLRQIVFLDYPEALKRLDAWMDSENGRKPPMPRDFLKVQPQKAHHDVFHVQQKRKWRIENGRLFDEEYREYVVDPTTYLPFYWNSSGIACQGSMEYSWIRRGGDT